MKVKAIRYNAIHIIPRIISVTETHSGQEFELEVQWRGDDFCCLVYGLHGYTLQKNRSDVEFKDFGETLKDEYERREAICRETLQQCLSEKTE